MTQKILTDEQLGANAERVHAFARVSPAHKQRIIRALQQKKHVMEKRPATYCSECLS
jgi:magnesium-transporting ATPase (P-type)